VLRETRHINLTVAIAPCLYHTNKWKNLLCGIPTKHHPPQTDKFIT